MSYIGLEYDPRRFFTITELLQRNGLDPKLARNPVFTQMLTGELIRAGYTQRNSNGRREWSKDWVDTPNARKTQQKVDIERWAEIVARVMRTL